MKYTFPRTVRLLTKLQFKQVFNKTKQKISKEAFTVYYCNNNLTYPRLGVIVPKREINQASKRNRFKRIVRECFRLNQHGFKGVDILVFIKEKAGVVLKEELEQCLLGRLSKLE